MQGEVGRELSIQHLLNCPPVTILCLCVSLLSLLFLANISNPHTPTLECMSQLRLGLWQKSPQKVLYDNN